MKILARGLVIVGLLIACSIGAMAGSGGIDWTLNNIAFSDGNTATGYFITNTAVNQIIGFSIVVSGPDHNADFVATEMVSAYLPNEVGAADAGFLQYMDLILSSPLTSSGGVVNIAQGFDCPGCGVLVLTDDPTIKGDPLSEPSALVILGGGLAIFGTMFGRKIVRS